MHRFFVPPKNIEEGEKVRFPEKTAHQLTRVLRLKSGSEVIVLDNSGNQFNVILSVLDEERVTGRVIASERAAGEPIHKLVLFIALSQRQKFEWMLQKCTEVGAAGFVPMVTERCLVQEGEYAENRLERWRRIIQEAAEQSCRGLIPELSEPIRFTSALEEMKRGGSPGFLLTKDEGTMGVMEAVQAFTKGRGRTDVLNVMVGPEGGFSREEVNMARVSAVHAVSLGSRTLRMETAAVVATALILYELGDFKPG